MWLTRSRPLLFTAFFVAAVLRPTAPPPAAACPQEEVVRITVVTILATERDTKVCPTLKCLAEEVRKKRPHLTGFCQALQCSKSVPVGKEETFDLVENQSAVVKVRNGANPLNRACLKVKTPGVGEITYSSVCGKFFPIVTEYRTANQETVILAIRVEPCKGKK